jgi:hypothetical protein
MSIEKLTDLYAIVDRERRESEEMVEKIKASPNETWGDQEYHEGRRNAYLTVMATLEDDFGVMPLTAPVGRRLKRWP